MTDPEWDAEVTAALAETGWLLESAAITDTYSYAFAAVHNRVTGAVKIVALPLKAFRMPAGRRVEILRQLA